VDLGGGKEKGRDGETGVIKFKTRGGKLSGRREGGDSEPRAQEQRRKKEKEKRKKTGVKKKKKVKRKLK